MVKQTKYFLLFFTLLLLVSTQAQKSVNGGQPLSQKNSSQKNKSVTSKTDTISSDSLSIDSIVPKKSKNGLDDVVKYQSKDSIVFMGSNFAKMYGDGKVNYKDIELKANYIQMSMDSSIVYAAGKKDSVGELVGTPDFKEKDAQYNSRTMRYNFKTKRGFITQVVTQQGEGYVIGGRTKKMENDEMYMTDCKYTTCDNHDHPHFYFNLTRAKVRPKKDIVTGPAYLVLEDVPLPLAIPFGFFPFTDKYSSGVLVPTFGEELTRGFYLRDGGYYFAVNDNFDLALRSEIFTKGSWGISAQSNYVKRYRFSGNFNMAFRTTVLGDKGAPDYSKSKDFNLNWSHSQDQKASPNTSFSASVNFSTSTFDRNDIGSVYDPRRFTQNNKSSSINLTHRFPNSPFSISASMNVNQRSQDSSIMLSLPDLNITMNRIFPFKRKDAIGSERWYEKIGLSYNGTIQNSINTKEDQLFHSNLIKDWRNGMKHSVPVSATFSLMKYINITPSFNYNEAWFSNEIRKSWDNANYREQNDTIWGFRRMYNYNASVGVSTKMYGFYKPIPALFGRKVQTIRHVFTPTLSFSASPNFQDESFGFWKSYTYVDTAGVAQIKHYSPYQNGLFYSAPGRKSGTVSFNMANNLEMKILSDRDSTGERKISLIDNFTTGISYNMAADSMNWSNINASIRIKLMKNFTLNLSGDFDTYTYKLDKNGNPVRVNELRLQKYGTLGRLMNTGTSFSYNFNNETFKKLFGGKEDKKNKSNQEKVGVNDPEQNLNPNPNDLNNPNNINNTDKKKEDKKDEYDSDGYMRWTVPWNLSFNYSMRYGYTTFNKTKLEYNRAITHNLGFSGNITLTKGWSFSASSSYDFDTKQISYTNINITRDLHCWQLTAGVVPFGPYRSYNLTISVRSSMLRDVKYDKRGNSYNAVPWY